MSSSFSPGLTQSVLADSEVGNPFLLVLDQSLIEYDSNTGTGCIVVPHSVIDKNGHLYYLPLHLVNPIGDQLTAQLYNSDDKMQRQLLSTKQIGSAGKRNLTTSLQTRIGRICTSSLNQQWRKGTIKSEDLLDQPFSFEQRIRLPLHWVPTTTPDLDAAFIKAELWSEAELENYQGVGDRNTMIGDAIKQATEFCKSYSANTHLDDVSQLELQSLWYRINEDLVDRTILYNGKEHDHLQKRDSDVARPWTLNKVSLVSRVGDIVGVESQFKHNTDRPELGMIKTYYYDVTNTDLTSGHVREMSVERGDGPDEETLYEGDGSDMDEDMSDA